ncbi:hypothetical protein Tco_0418399 [Tanacetum coccineum]
MHPSALCLRQASSNQWLGGKSKQKLGRRNKSTTGGKKQRLDRRNDTSIIPVEIGMPTLRTVETNIVQNDEALEINLDLLEERREQEAIREARSKAKI